MRFPLPAICWSSTVSGMRELNEADVAMIEALAFRRKPPMSLATIACWIYGDEALTPRGTVSLIAQREIRRMVRLLESERNALDA